MIKNRVTIAACFIVALMGASASAGTIDLNAVWNGGLPFQGTNVSFNDVIETNTNGPGGTAFNHYQNPQAIGNSLVLNPVNFRAEVNPGPGFDFLDSQLNLVIMANQGQSFDIVDFLERGDYSVFSTTGGATVRAELNWFYTILAGNGAGTSGSGTEVFTTTAGALNSGPWDLDFNIPTPGATKVRLTFDNKLTAIADNNGFAFIAKKQIPGITITVPEPASFAIAALGMVMLVAARRLRRS